MNNKSNSEYLHESAILTQRSAKRGFITNLVIVCGLIAGIITIMFLWSELYSSKETEIENTVKELQTAEKKKELYKDVLANSDTSSTNRELIERIDRIEQEYYIYPIDGLVLREQPNKKAKRIASFSGGEFVYIDSTIHAKDSFDYPLLELPNSSDKIVIKGGYIKVIKDSTSGYLYNGLIGSLPFNLSVSTLEEYFIYLSNNAKFKARFSPKLELSPGFQNILSLKNTSLQEAMLVSRHIFKIDQLLKESKDPRISLDNTKYELFTQDVTITIASDHLSNRIFIIETLRPEEFHFEELQDQKEELVDKRTFKKPKKQLDSVKVDPNSRKLKPYRTTINKSIPIEKR